MCVKNRLDSFCIYYICTAVHFVLFFSQRRVMDRWLMDRLAQAIVLLDFLVFFLKCNFVCLLWDLPCLCFDCVCRSDLAIIFTHERSFQLCIDLRRMFVLRWLSFLGLLSLLSRSLAGDLILLSEKGNPLRLIGRLNPVTDSYRRNKDEFTYSLLNSFVVVVVAIFNSNVHLVVLFIAVIVYTGRI